MLAGPPHRREEIARVVHNMPKRERYGLVSTLTAFTTAGGEPQPVSKSKAGESAALIFTKVDRASRCTEDLPACCVCLRSSTTTMIGATDDQSHRHKV